MSWKFEILAGPFGATTEGPVWDGTYLFFTVIQHSRIMRYNPRTRECTEWKEETQHVNGLAFDRKGQLYGCCAGGRSIVAVDEDQIAPVVDRFKGELLNTPNDLCVDAQGRIWFTNPWNEIFVPPDDTPATDAAVFRAESRVDGSWALSQMTFDMTKPNGIALSADEKILYVAESDYGEDRLRDLRAYPVLDQGLGPPVVLHQFAKDYRGVHRGIDGMCIDGEGNIVATAGWEISGPGSMIYVFAPTGRVLQTHEVPVKRPTNCCFGGAGLRTLFVTTLEGYLLAAATETPGLPLGAAPARTA